MILILSNKLDQSTQNVCEWLNYTKSDYFYADINYFYKIYNGEIPEKFLNSYIKNIDLIKVVWNRRWDYSLIEANNYIEQVKLNEFKIFSNYIFKKISNVFWMDKMDSINIDKLTQLDVASKSGLKCLPYILTNNKSDLSLFMFKEGTLITKSLGTTININKKQKQYTTFTSMIDEKGIERIPNIFSLSFFQKFIDKIDDIKIICIGEKLFPIAIESQNNFKTKIDFRKYDWNNPNRNFSHKIPDDLSEKILNFMKMIDLKFGIIDFIYGKDFCYYFLEVNPIGQFSYISGFSGANIEQEIAEYLSQNN
jgi:hypothetical protein